MYEVITLMMLCKPTYKTRRNPIAAIIGGNKITSAGINGIIVPNA